MTVNFQAFIDESDSSTELGEFILAGHIATAEAWVEFKKNWEPLLPVAGTLAKNGHYHFKMREMARKPECMARVPAFYKIIEENVAVSISARINVHDLRRACDKVATTFRNVHGVAVNFGMWSNPWFFTFRFLLDKFHNERRQFHEILPLDRK